MTIAAQFARIPIPVEFREGPPDRAPETLSKTRMSVAEMRYFKTPRERRPALVDKDLPPDQLADANLQVLVKSYYRVLPGVDENVGRVLDFFYKVKPGRGHDRSLRLGQRLFPRRVGFYDKRLMYEPSTRVPMLMRWPKSIRAGQGGLGVAVSDTRTAARVGAV